MGITALGAFVRERTGAEVRLLDAVVEGHDRVERLDQYNVRFGLSFDAIQRRIAEFGPDLLGLSTIFSSQFPFVREIVRRAKAEDPGLFTVSGGTYPSFLPEHALNTSALDAVVIGEGELPLEAIIRRLDAGGSLAGMPAVASRQNGGLSISTERQMIADLDTLPTPARDLLPIEKYFRLNLPFGSLSRHRRNLPIITSRGCPYHCRFCSSTQHWGNRYRMRGVDHVLDELQMLKEKFGTREIKFQDDNLTLDKDRAKRLFKGMIERGFGFFWNTPNGIAIRHLDDEMLGLMKQSGCYELTLAIESGDPDVLKNIIHKPLDLDEARRAAARIKAHGIETCGFFIIGFPGERRAQMENTLRFAVELELDRSYILMYTPLPGTELGEKAVRDGLVREGFDYETENNYHYPSVKTPDVSFDEMVEMQRRAFRKINFRLLRTRPDRFIRKYANTFITNPGLLVKFFRYLRA